MSELKLNSAVSPTALMRLSIRPGHARTLQAANQRALQHLGWLCTDTSDPKGRVLRQLRLQLEINPSWLATNACMSLSQLYALENGGDSCFYSDTLRCQAGRRVAGLLGADWDRLPLEVKNKEPHSSNVVHLQRPAGHSTQIMPLDERSPFVLMKVPQDRLPQTSVDITDHTSSHHNPVLQTSLNEPGNDPVLVAPSKSRNDTTLKASVQSEYHLLTGLGLLMVIVACIGAGYFFALYNPYRFLWPW